MTARTNDPLWLDSCEAALRHAAASLPRPARCGRVVRAMGSVIQVAGLNARVGDACEFRQPGAHWRLRGEVIGIDREDAVVLPLGPLDGVSPRTQVWLLDREAFVQASDSLMGQVLDGLGRPWNAPSGAVPGEDAARAAPGPDTCVRSLRYPLKGAPPDALRRPAIDTPLPTGVRAIDALLTCGSGQRLGIFAPAGTGKSTLLAMLAQGCRCDVIVLALVGERGREVGEFLELFRRLGIAGRTVLVVATSDRPPAERAKAPEVAMACAEYFRDQGRSVLLMVDSITRFARALREIGLAAGEPPTRRGYPPSVFGSLPRLFERAGRTERGDITAFFTVLVDDDAAGDPIAEEARATLDGHIVLSPRLSDGGHYPAIDVLGSRSRLMSRLVQREHERAATRVRELLQKRQEIETLVQIGEYQPGSDELADHAWAVRDELTRFLRQEPGEASDFDTTIGQLRRLTAAPSRQAPKDNGPAPKS